MGLWRYLKNQFRHDRNIKLILGEQIEEIRALQSLLVKQRMQLMMDKILNSNEPGVTTDKSCNHEVVVSLTTFGNRIHDVCYVIESIMQGSMRPNRIVLWLAEDEFEGKKLPQTLLLQQRRGLEIRYCEDNKSYNKLIPSLKAFPDSCIVTIDDDALYELDFLDKIVMAHAENPNDICACRVHRIKLDGDGCPLSYMDWNWCINEVGENKLNFFTGVGGVLYPPHCFPDEVFDQKTFMEICRFADDVWFNLMALKKGVGVFKVFARNPLGDILELPSSGIDALSKENTDELTCRNDIQIKAVMDKYDLYRYLQN